MMNKVKNGCDRCESTEGKRTLMTLKSKVTNRSITAIVCDHCKEMLTRLGWKEKLAIHTKKEEVTKVKEEKKFVDYAEIARRSKASQQHWGG